MGATRKLKRQAIKSQCYLEGGNTEDFKKEWENYHYKRREEIDKNGNVKSTRKRKSENKQHHDDSGKLFKQFKAIKSFTDMKDKAKNKKDKKTKVI